MKVQKIPQPEPVEPDFVNLKLTRSEALRLLVLAGHMSWKDLSKEHNADAKRLGLGRPEEINTLTQPLYDALLKLFNAENISEISR